MRSSNDWTLPALSRTFRLRRVTEHPVLQAWMTADQAAEEITDDEHRFLLLLQRHLNRNVFGWNEQELSLNFIGPLITLVNFSTDNTNFFAGREFEGVVNGEPMRGKPDGMVATGEMEPDSPFFCFQEYKKNIDPNGDPYGQCLAAMLVARELNQREHPIFGVVVVGQQWSFIVLDGESYALSHGFIALDNDLFQIFRMLKALKRKIVALAAN